MGTSGMFFCTSTDDNYHVQIRVRSFVDPYIASSNSVYIAGAPCATVSDQLAATANGWMQLSGDLAWADEGVGCVIINSKLPESGQIRIPVDVACMAIGPVLDKLIKDHLTPVAFQPGEAAFRESNSTYACQGSLVSDPGITMNYDIVHTNDPVGAFVAALVCNGTSQLPIVHLPAINLGPFSGLDRNGGVSRFRNTIPCRPSDVFC